MIALDGCSSAASRKGLIASAGCPAASSSVARESSIVTCCAADGLGNWVMARTWGENLG